MRRGPRWGSQKLQKRRGEKFSLAPTEVSRENVGKGSGPGFRSVNFFLTCGDLHFRVMLLP